MYKVYNCKCHGIVLNARCNACIYLKVRNIVHKGPGSHYITKEIFMIWIDVR